MISFLCLLIALVVGVFVGRPMFARGGPAVAASKRKSRHAVLVEQRDSLYATIRELDFDHRMGKVDDEDYRRMRGEYAGQAVALLKEIDRGDGRGRASEEVEQEVASLRKKGRGGRSQAPVSCPSCGSKMKADDRFCAQCGSGVGDG